MAKYVETKFGEVFHKGNVLDVEAVYYKTICQVVVLDYTKYFPIVEEYKCSSKMGIQDILDEVRERCIAKGLI